jgi:chromate transporter
MGGAPTALLCLVAIFLPSFLLVFGTLPFWQDLRRLSIAQSLLRGVNAAVVGLLLAAFYNPVWLSGILSKGDFALAAADFVMLFLWKAPPWLVVVLSAIGGQLLSTLT